MDYRFLLLPQTSLMTGRALGAHWPEDLLVRILALNLERKRLCLLVVFSGKAGQSEPEGAAPARRALDADLSTQLFDDASYYR